MKRWIRLLLVLVVGSFALTSCTPDADGSVGIERQSDGSLKVLVRMCEGSLSRVVVDGANNYPTREIGASGNTAWKSAPNYFTKFAELIHGEGEAVLELPEDELLDTVLYTTIGYGPEGYAVGGYFGAEELRALEPNQILAYPRFDVDASFELLSRIEFDAASAEFCR